MVTSFGLSWQMCEWRIANVRMVNDYESIKATDQSLVQTNPLHRRHVDVTSHIVG